MTNGLMAYGLMAYGLMAYGLMAHGLMARPSPRLDGTNLELALTFSDGPTSSDEPASSTSTIMREEKKPRHSK